MVPIETHIYDLLLVINTNLPPILNRFQDIAVDRSEIGILGGGVPGDDLRKIFNGCQRMAKVPNAEEILPKI